MLSITILLFFGASLALAQSACSTQSTPAFSPVVLRYTPSVTPQTGPTSTVWQQIVTTWYNAVDCRYVTPLRVDENLAADGPFTTYVYSPTLTITRVGCMPETTAVTRRDVRGDEVLDVNTASSPGHKINKRRTAQDAIDTVIDQTAAILPPSAGALTVQAYNYLVSLNTAIFAINLVDTGFDLSQTCSQLQDPSSQVKLISSGIDPAQAANIVCFAATNGLYLPVPTSEIISDLQTLTYRIQFESGSPVDSDELCQFVSIPEASALGIDVDGIESYLCPNEPVTSSILGATITIGPTVSAGTSLPEPLSTGPYANVTEVSFTSGPGPYVNATVVGTYASPAPYANATGVDSSPYGTGISFPTASFYSSGTGTGDSPEASSTQEPGSNLTSSAALHRYHRW